MALRAGYYGIKRFLRDKLETIAITYDETIQSLFPRSEQAVLGAKNLYKPVPSKTLSLSGITWTISSDGPVNANGTATALSSVALTERYGVVGEKLFIPNGKYIFNGGVSDDTTLVRLGITKNGAYSNLGDGNGDIPFTINGDDGSNDGAYLQIALQVLNGKTVDDVVFKPMIRLATDPDPAFVLSAMTNRELTVSAADQKTAINAIITAATGAADFAAFKTAMGAITPVTRSLSLTKEDITEEVKEDVEPEKTVTKKRTTKKTEEE